jgi:hypothetical protein
LILGIAGALLLPAALLAQEGVPQTPGGASLAARLSSVDGQVRLAQGGQTLADPAVVNAPLFEGTEIVTSDDGRAEIQFEDGSVARISPNSALLLSTLQPVDGGAKAELLLESGLGYFELQGANTGGSMRICFADAVVTASGFTVLRVNLDNPPGELSVFSGNAHLERGSALTLDLHGGESVALNASDPARYNLAESIEPDSWDVWNEDRDQVLNALGAARTKVSDVYPDASNPAWGDLDSSGVWYNLPGTGYVWSPYEAAGAGWDPYGSGYWMWTPRFGYVWVSGNSWGYLPYQCGLWNFYDGFGWGWAPGMGVCSPWWGKGIFGVNIGIAPGNYRPLRKPLPVTPNPRGPRPHRGGQAPAEHGLIAVNRTPLAEGSAFPARERNSPMTIGGQTVRAVRPIAPRPQYEHATVGSVNRGRVEYGGEAAKPGALVTPHSGAVAGYGYGSGSRNAAPQNPSAQGSRSSYGSNSRPPAGGSAPSHNSGSTAGSSGHSGGSGSGGSGRSGGESSGSAGGAVHSSGGGGSSSAGSASGTHR